MSDYSPRDLGPYRPPGYEAPRYVFDMVLGFEYRFYATRAKWTDEEKTCLYHTPEVLTQIDYPLTLGEIESVWPIRMMAWAFVREQLACGSVTAISVDGGGNVRPIPHLFWKTDAALEALESGSIEQSALHNFGGAVFLNETEMLNDCRISYGVRDANFTFESIDKEALQLHEAIKAAEAERGTGRLTAPPQVQQAIGNSPAAKMIGRPRVADDAAFFAVVVCLVHETGFPKTKAELCRRAQRAFLDETGTQVSDDWVRERISAVWRRWEKVRQSSA